MKRVKTPEEMGVEVIAFLRQLPTGLGRRGVVLVPREAVAHELRCQVVKERDGAAPLCGVRFLTPAALASEVCIRAGRPLRAGLEQTWPAVLDYLIQEGELDGKLAHFDLAHLREHETYPTAFATSLLELDRCGLEAAQIEKLSAVRRNSCCLRFSSILGQS